MVCGDGQMGSDGAFGAPPFNPRIETTRIASPPFAGLPKRCRSKVQDTV